MDAFRRLEGIDRETSGNDIELEQTDLPGERKAVIGIERKKCQGQPDKDVATLAGEPCLKTFCVLIFQVFSFIGTHLCDDTLSKSLI